MINGGNLQDVAGKVIEILRTGNDAVVVSAKENEDYIAAVDCGKKHGMNRQDVARYTQEKIGELSRLILKEVKVQGVFLTGGDTAISFMNKNGASGARLIEDVLPVIALIELDGGDYPNLPCIVKGGSIGDEDALVKCIRYFHSK